MSSPPRRAPTKSQTRADGRPPQVKRTNPVLTALAAVGALMGGVSAAVELYRFASGEPDFRAALRALSGTRFVQIGTLQQFILGPGDIRRVEGEFCGGDGVQVVFCGPITNGEDDAEWEIRVGSAPLGHWEHTPSTIVGLVLAPDAVCGRMEIEQVGSHRTNVDVQVVVAPMASVWDAVNACARGTYAREIAETNVTALLPGDDL